MSSSSIFAMIIDNQTNQGLEGQKGNHMARYVGETDTSVSPKMIAEEAEESKTPSAWSVISNCSPPTSAKHNSSPISCKNERKQDAAATCRLFGFDLKNPLISPIAENSSNISDDAPQEADVFIKGQSKAPRKDVQNRSVQSRSRTKVL